jgi:hypothetical protein
MSKNKQFKDGKDGLEAIKTKKTTINAEGIIKELLGPTPASGGPMIKISQALNSIGIEPEINEEKIKKKRGGKPENLALGRKKLAETWEEKRRMKEELIQKAIDKKINLAIKQKEQIYKNFDVKSDSEEEEEITEPIKRVIKKPVKTRVKKYIEISDEEEEPEIIYKKKVVNKAINNPIQRSQGIVFY